MLEYRVTEVTFGLGFQTGSTRTQQINDHIQQTASQGWRLVQVDRNSFEVPITWRFFWEREAPQSASPD